MATDVAFTVPASRAQALRERLVRMQDELFGTRLLRGTIALGGVKRDLIPPGRDALRDAKTAIHDMRSDAGWARRMRGIYRPGL